MHQLRVLFVAAVVLAAATRAAQYPVGMGNWMRPEIEGLVTTTVYDEHHVLYGNYDEAAGKWTALSFTQESDSAESPRVAVAEVFQNVDAPHKWEVIKVRSLDARDAHFTVGFAEAAVTHERMFDAWFNVVRLDSQAYQADPTMLAFMTNQTATLKAYPTNTAFGEQVRGVVRQIDGLWAGWQFAYEAAGSPALMRNFTAHSVYMLSYKDDADYASKSLNAIDEAQAAAWAEVRAHCFSVAHLIDGELEFGHTTFTEYVDMLRQFKTYEFLGGHNVTFTGYPGLVFSSDDFLINGHGVHVMSTALGNANIANMMKMTPKRLPGFAALMATAYLATTPAEAAVMFGEQMTGSYPVMLLLSDTKKAYTAYKQNTTLPAGTFYVVEVAPEIWRHADLTSTLVEQGHFLSFDIPYFPEMAAELGFYNSLVEAKFFDNGFYANSTIAAAVRRDMPYIVNTTTLFYAMRHNNYPHDPIFANPQCQGSSPYGFLPCDNISLVVNANNSVPIFGAAPRRDIGLLRKQKPGATGGIDAKAQSVSMIYEQQGSVIAQNGPTTVQQEPFSFSGYNERFPPPYVYALGETRGLPDRFDFPPGVLSPHAPFVTKAQPPQRSSAPVGIAIAISVVVAAAAVGAFVVLRQRRQSRRGQDAGEGTALL